MKICFVTFEYPPFTIGGAGGYAENLVNELSKLGHEIFVIAPTIEKKDVIEPIEESTNINIIRVPIVNIPALRFFTFQLKLKNVVSEIERKYGKMDIFHANGIADLIISHSKRPRVVTVHHSIRDIQQRSAFKFKFHNFISEENPIGRYMEQKTILNADEIISVSNNTKQFITDFYDLDHNNVHVIHNGVYANQYFFPNENVAAMKSIFKINENEKLILCAPGRFDEPRKGVKYLLLALQKVFPEIKSKCIIIGSGNKDTLIEYLEKLPGNNVIFTGYIDQEFKKKMFAMCDLFVLPSLLEGCPLSILEALAAGKPIVSINVGGIPELVKQHRNGILVKPKNPEQLAEAIISILLNKEKSEVIQINNYNDARDIFTWQKTAELTEKVYELAIAKYKVKT